MASGRSTRSTPVRSMSERSPGGLAPARGRRSVRQAAARIMDCADVRHVAIVAGSEQRDSPTAATEAIALPLEEDTRPVGTLATGQVQPRGGPVRFRRVGRMGCPGTSRRGGVHALLHEGRTKREDDLLRTCVIELQHTVGFLRRTSFRDDAVVGDRDPHGERTARGHEIWCDDLQAVVRRLRPGDAADWDERVRASDRDVSWAAIVRGTRRMPSIASRPCCGSRRPAMGTGMRCPVSM